MDIYRKNPVPAIYTWLPFVRASLPRLLADCPDDKARLEQIQNVATGRACVSDLESPTEIIVKAEFPDNILERTYDSGEGIKWTCCYWKLWDAEFLLTGIEPAEAVCLMDAGIDELFFDALADPTSCIPFLRKVEGVFPKGYSLSSETAAKLEEHENPIIAQVELKAMKRRTPSRTRKRAVQNADPAVSPTLRRDILLRDDERCVFCGQGPPTVSLEVDHIIPRSLINKLHLDAALHTARYNLYTMCVPCNRGQARPLGQKRHRPLHSGVFRCQPSKSSYRSSFADDC